MTIRHGEQIFHSREDTAEAAVGEYLLETIGEVTDLYLAERFVSNRLHCTAYCSTPHGNRIFELEVT